MNPLLSPAAALGSAATLGIADFTGGAAGRRSSPPSVAIGVEAVGFIALPLALWLLPLRLDGIAAAFAFAGGAVGGLGLIAFYRAMAMNLIGVVAPVTAVVAAALPVAFGLMLGGERLHVGQLAGIGAGLVAIALINGGGGEVSREARAAVGLAILAGAAFVPRREVWPLLGLGGAFDGTGVVLYLFATFHGLLSLSALLTSFYPAFTVLCARVFLRERLSVIQATGAVVAIVAVALIAAT